MTSVVRKQLVAHVPPASAAFAMTVLKEVSTVTAAKSGVRTNVPATLRKAQMKVHRF